MPPLQRRLNEHLVSNGKEPVFTYLIAGGDKALFTSQEAPEDDPNLGAADLIQVVFSKIISPHCWVFEFVSSMCKIID